MDLLPSKEELDAKYKYDPETGILYFKYHREQRYIGGPVGCLDRYGYLVTSINSKTVKVHRIIWKMVYREEPETIDHINNDRSDNRLENLQAVTAKENIKLRYKRTIRDGVYTEEYSINYHGGICKWVLIGNGDRSKKSFGCFDSLKEAQLWVNTYGLVNKNKIWDGKKGIVWHKLNNKWIVTVPRMLGGPKHLGYFKTHEEAYNELYDYFNNVGVPISSNCVRSTRSWS